MTDGKAPERPASASPFAIAFIVGTFCYALHSFTPKIPGIAAFLIGFVGAFSAQYVYPFVVLPVRQRYAVGAARSAGSVDAHRTEEPEPEAKSDARKA